LNKVVRNEQRKLKANFYNGIAIAAVGIGGLTQAASMIQSASILPAVPFFVVICLSAAYILHMAGWAALRELEE
jgi:choline-glycine betaine transporter